MATNDQFLPIFQEDAESVRTRIDADANNGLDVDDPRWVDTRPGSFFWDATQPLVLEFARLWDALSVEVPSAAFVPFAWGDFLDYHASVFGLERKPAVAATAEVAFVGDPATVVGSGTVVSVDSEDEEGNAVEFMTVASGVTGAQLDDPATPTATPSNTGGSLATGNYFYVVSAYNEFGETLPSTEVQATVTGPTGSVALDWPDVAGADGYRIYRGTVAEDDKVRVWSGPLSTHTDTGDSPLSGAVPDQNLTAGVTLDVEAVVEGTASNVAALSIVNLDTPNAGIDAVYNLAPSEGGEDDELDEALRERILLEYGGGGPGNSNDYRRWALAFPGVGRVFVNPVWDGPGTVQVVVMTATGDPVSSTVIADLQEDLDPVPEHGEGTAPVGATVTVQTPAVVGIDVVASVQFQAGFSLDGAGGTTPRRAEIQAALSRYIDNLDVGDDVIYEHVKAQFFQVPGVYNISGVTVEGGTANVTVSSDPPQTAQLYSTTLS